jgi:hypothetical protein
MLAMADACLDSKLPGQRLLAFLPFRFRSWKAVDAALDWAILGLGAALAPDIILSSDFGLRPNRYDADRHKDRCLHGIQFGLI